jgi:TP901 family phage tail tape measure protein
MAQGEGNIIIDVGGNTRQLEKDIAKVANQSINLNIKGFGQPLGKISGQLGEFEKSLAASNARVLAFGASAGAIYAVEKALGDTLRSAIKVQKSLQDINVILNASTSSLKNFGGELFNIAKDTGQSFDVVAKAATELSRQGLGVEQTLKRTSDALILTRLSGLDTVSSVEALTAAINSFSKSALDSTSIINKLAAVDAGFAVSSGDLAEAIKRVGSSAEDAGVSFDQLIAIVTSAQQITSRGGSVIGNSLKTIFTRLQRPKVLDDLEAIGVVTRDQAGNIRPLIQILSDLSKSYETLSGVQKSSIAETVGGVFQINILKAALGDLNSEYSIYSRALSASTGATDEAIQRNEQLNQTLDSLINKTVQNLTKVSAAVGGDVFGPAIQKILGGLNTALESFDEGQSQDVGNKIGKGLLKGLGDFLSGPGLAIGGLALFKIFERLTVYAADAFKSIAGLNSQAAEQKILQSQILSILSKNPDIIKQINSGQTSLVSVHQTLLSLIQKETAALTQQASIASTLSQSLYGAGVRVAKTGPTKGLPTKHGGFIPNYSLSEELAGVQGSSDYSRSEKNKARPFLTNLNGQMVYANDQEIKVPASNIYKKMGLPDGTKPKNPSEKYGILNPRQQKMLGFSSGFVPNFKNPNQLKSQDVADQIAQFGSVANMPSNQFDPTQSKNKLDALKNSLQGLRVLKAAISKSPDFSGKKNLTDKLDTTYNDLKKRYDDQKQSYTKTLYNSKESIYSAVLGEQDINQQYSRGFIPNLAAASPVQIDLNTLDKTIGSKYGVLVGQGQNESPANYTQGVTDIPVLKNVLPKGSGVSVKLKQRAAFPLTSGGIAQSEKEFDGLLQNAIGPGLQNFAQNIKKNILGKDESVQPFVNQLGKDVKGSLFEKSVRAALVGPNQVDRIASDDPQAPFDFDPASSFLGFQDLFGLKNVKAVEAKVSEEAAKSGRLPNKVLAKEPSLLKKIIGKYGAGGIPKFGGFVPNFEDTLDGARQEAFEREKSASGLPNSQIKLVKDRRLKNSLNPYGEAVINKRDEPSGTAMEGIKRFKSLKDARRAGMPDMRWMGYVPNFAKYGARDPKTGRFVKQTQKGAEETLDTAPAQSALSKFQEKALLASFAFSTLGGVIEQFTGEEDKKAKNFINAVSSGASAFATLAGVIPGQAGLIIGAVAGIGVAANGLIKTLNEKSPGIASSLEKVKEENQKFSDATDRYLQTYNQLNETISNTEGDQEKVSQQIVKLNNELAKIAFDLPEAYRKEILTTSNIGDLQEKIGQVKAQQLEKEKALTTALDIQSKIDASQGIGRMFLGMGQNVLNKPGEARKAGGGVIKDIGMDNLIKLAEDTKLVNESQKDLIKTLEQTYGMSQEVGAALSQLSSSDFESLRAVLINTANDTKNVKDMTEELNKVRKEETEKIRNLNKAISESKAKLSDLTKQLFNDISAQRGLGTIQKQNSRDVSLKELENRANLNKPFQSENTQALSSYYLDLVKNEKEYAEKSQQIIEEGNQEIIKQFQEVLAKGGTDTASIDLTAQQETLQKIASSLKDANFNVTPDWLGAEFEKVLKGQQVDQEELKKLSKLTEDQKRELGQKIAQQTEVLRKANDLAALQLAFARQAAKNAIDLKSAGGFEGYLNPEARKAEIEKELNAYNTIYTMADQGTAGKMPAQYGRAVSEIAKQDQANFGIGPTSLQLDTINQGNSKRIQAEIDSTIELKKNEIAKTQKEVGKAETAKGATLYNAEENKTISSDAISRIYGIDKEIKKADEARGKLAEDKYNKEDEITKSTNDLSKAANAEERKIAQDKIAEQTKNLNEIQKEDKDLQQKQKDARERREKIYKEEVPESTAGSLREMDTRVEFNRRQAIAEEVQMKQYKKIDASSIAEKQSAEAYKTAPLDNDNYFKGVADLRKAIEGDNAKNKPLTEEAFKQASKEASDANVQAIKDLLNEIKNAEADKEAAQKNAEEATKRANKEIEAKQAEGKTAASKEALKASSKSLFGAKAQQYSFYGEDESRGARMSAGAKDIPQVIDQALKENPNIGSTEDLIKELKTNKGFGAKITAGTSIGEGDLQTELEAAVAKKGTGQREGAFVGGIDSYIQNSRNQQKLQSQLLPTTPMQSQMVGNTMIGMPNQQAYPFQDNSFMDYQAPQLPTSTIGMNGPTNTIEDFLRNPPAGPLTPQPQTTEGRIGLGMTGTLGSNGASVQGNTSAQFDDIMKMEEEKSKKNWARIQANAEKDGGLSASYGFTSRIGEMADAELKAESKKNEAGGRYLDKKYGLEDSSENAKQNQLKSTESLTQDRKEGSKRKEEDSKAQANLQASLDNLSGKIEANTETQTKKNDKEDQKGGEGDVKAKAEVDVPSKIEFGPIKIDVSVNGSIDQLPDATSQKTVAAIRDAVNQILPGEISRRLGALKT